MAALTLPGGRSRPAAIGPPQPARHNRPVSIGPPQLARRNRPAITGPFQSALGRHNRPAVPAPSAHHNRPAVTGAPRPYNCPASEARPAADRKRGLDRPPGQSGPGSSTCPGWARAGGPGRLLSGSRRRQRDEFSAWAECTVPDRRSSPTTGILRAIRPFKLGPARPAGAFRAGWLDWTGSISKLVQSFKLAVLEQLEKRSGEY